MTNPYDNMQTRTLSGTPIDMVKNTIPEQPYVPGHEDMWLALEALRDYKRKPYQSDSEVLNEFRIIVGKVLRGES